MLLNFYCCFVLCLVVKFRQIKLKKVSVLIFLSGLHPHLFLILGRFNSASQEFRDVVTFTTQDRSRRPAEIHCVLGGNKSSRPIAWTWWKSIALLDEIKGQCLVVRPQGDRQTSLDFTLVTMAGDKTPGTQKNLDFTQE